MTVTYEAISSTTLVSAQSSVTLNSFSGYTDLVLISNAKVSVASDVGIYFNGDTSSLYSVTNMSGNGSTAVSSRLSARSSIEVDYYGYPDATNFNVGIFHIMNYANTTTFKTLLGRSSNASTGVDAVVGLYRSTSAITSLTLDPVGTATFSIGSTFSLYGIKAE